MIKRLNILISNIGLLDAHNAAFLRSYYFAKALASFGHKVTFITTQRSGFHFPYKKMNRDDIEIYAVASLFPIKIRKFGYDLLPLLIRIMIIINKRFDIVHSDNHRPNSFLPCIIHRFFYKSKYIAEWWDYFGKTGQYDKKALIWKKTIGPIDNFLETYTKKKADGVVVLSELLYQRAINIPVPNNKIKIIWGGSDVETIKFYQSSIVNRSRFNLPADKFLFFSTGMGAVEILEYRPFFEALVALYKRRQDFAFVRTGSPVPDYIKNELKINNILLEVGFVDYSDYGTVLSCSDMFVLVQENNNKNKGRWPNCIGDYIAAGRHILMNLIGDLETFHKKHPIGTIVIERDKEQILETIINILDNKTKYEKERKKIIDFAKVQFSWEKRARELENFYIKG